MKTYIDYKNADSTLDDSADDDKSNIYVGDKPCLVP